MTVDVATLGRHVALPEVGAQGIERLRAARAEVPAGPASGDERAYLERLGVTCLPVAGAPSAFPHAHAFRHRDPLDLAAAAWRALGVARGALGLGEGAP